MITLEISGFRLSEVAKIISKYPIKSTIRNQKIIFNGDVPENCINELLNIGLEIKAISNEKSETNGSSDISRSKLANNPTINSISGYSHPSLITQSKDHLTRIPANADVYKVLYPSPKCGELYWVDFGQPFGYEEAFIRPALVVKTGGIFKSVTTVIPMSSQVERYEDSNFTPIFSLTAENVVDYQSTKLSTEKFSCLLVEQIRTVDNSRLRGYIGSLEPNFLNILMMKVRNMFMLEHEEFSKMTS
jgi:mRNA-degrading endonuclease toxin of MazEF toxin-antitoxin module